MQDWNLEDFASMSLSEQEDFIKSSIHPPLSDPRRAQLNDRDGSLARFEQEHKDKLDAFWQEKNLEALDIDPKSGEMKNHPFPLARIRRIMKSDEKVKMVSAETIILFAKASELFLQELTLRSWMQTKEGRHKTVQRRDIAKSIQTHPTMDFLEDRVELGPETGRDVDQQIGAASMIRVDQEGDIAPLFDINEEHVMNPEGYVKYENTEFEGTGNHASSSK
ncbi:hypothetical protein ACFE04_004900 [Oxalis oulophora]